jgi:hypothetical protein
MAVVLLIEKIFFAARKNPDLCQTIALVLLEDSQGDDDDDGQREGDLECTDDSSTSLEF